MSRRKQTNRRYVQRRREIERRKNKTILGALLSWLIPKEALFAEDRFHGNIKWVPEQLAQQALIWAWQDTTNVTDAFTMMFEVCKHLKI